MTWKGKEELTMTLQVVRANRLGDGRVVFLADGYRWVEEIGLARVGDNEEAAKALLAIAEKAAADRLVVAPYLIDVSADGERIMPTRYREVLRAFGPSTHPALGRPPSVATAAAQRQRHMYQYDGYDQTLGNERVEQFRDQVRRRVAGELSEDEFKPLRLMNGLYLQLHAYMLRIAIPYGTLSTTQLRKLAEIARRYDKSYG